MLLRSPAPTGATHIVEYGLQYNPWQFDSVNNTLVADLQPQWFRMHAPFQARYPYENYEKLMNAYPGVNVLMIIGPYAMGAWEEGCTYRRTNDFPVPAQNAMVSSCGWSLQDWDANVSRLVKDFPNVHAWEIWATPEWTQGGYLCCNKDVSLLAHRYFDMLKDAYQIIKAHDPNDTVMALSVNLYHYTYSRTAWIRQFVEEVWKLGGANYCDAISFSAYTDNEPWETDRPGNVWLAQLEEFEALTGKPVWITDTSMPSNDPIHGGTPESQATFLTQTFTFFSQYPYVKVIIWGCLYAEDESGFDYGLLTLGPVSQQAPKPAYYAFQHFTKKQTTT
jgi:hypothetical protein